jgi:hypothetical protein
MAEIESPPGVTIEEEWETLTVQHKGKPNAGYAMIGSSLPFAVVVGIYLLSSGPVGEDDLSFVCVVGPILLFVLFLGVRALINTTILTADKSAISVTVRPLPLRPAKKVSVADVRTLGIEVKKMSGKRGPTITYVLVAHHRDGGTTRLMKFKDFDFKAAAHFVKDLLRERLGLE